MKAIMEQNIFEDSIRDYVIKNVDPNNGTISYDLIRKPKTHTLVLGGKRVNNDSTKEIKPRVSFRSGIEPRKVYTPNGKFDGVIDAAKYYNVSKQSIYNKVNSNEEEYKEYYYEKY